MISQLRIHQNWAGSSVRLVVASAVFLLCTLAETPGRADTTGQPLLVGVYGANAGICTKWDRFPDGMKFVGIGIRPNIPVEGTKRDVVEGRDLILDKATPFLKDNR